MTLSISMSPWSSAEKLSLRHCTDTTQATTLHVVLVTAAGFPVEDDALLPRQRQDTEC
jgi:hypothetical protein